MIDRPILQIDGPAGAGKTTLAEALLRSTRLDAICMRASRDRSARDFEEIPDEDSPELQRYLSAGASGAAGCRFPRPDTDAFYQSDFMADFSDAVLIEGDRPLDWAELVVFVMRPSAAAPDLLERSSTARARKDPGILDQLLEELAGHTGRKRGASASARRKRWTVNAGYQGVENAQLVVVNVHDPAERPHAERLVEQVKRLRTDADVFQDVLGITGSKVPITTVVADLSDPRDPGLRKALTRIKRSLKRAD